VIVQGDGELTVGLDIGTTKICAVVGNVTRDGTDIVGTGTHASVGLRKGVVVNIESTVDSIQKAVEEAELMAGCEIRSVYAGIAGGHIKGFNSHGIVAIKGSEVTEKDIERVIDAARAVAIPMDREVIHVLPQEFIVDEQDGIQDPLGMSGVRLEARVHIVTGAVTSAQNIIKCANRAGLDVCDIVLQSLASSEAVLTEEEKALGAALIDFGGGTTDLAVLKGNSIKHTSVLALGGNNLTHDISVGLRTPMGEAEKIKIKYGSCLTSKIGSENTFKANTGRDPRTQSRRDLQSSPQGGLWG
jgi:cell division protein FtsA